MATGYAVLVGAGELNNEHYLAQYGKTYDTYPVSGFGIDIRNIANILRFNNFQDSNIITLTGTSATTQEVIGKLSDVSKKVREDDLFVFYYTGHGDLLVDKNGDELSKFDQVMVLFNDYLIDDQLSMCFNLFPSKTRVVMIVDACHSGTMEQSIGIDKTTAFSLATDKFIDKLIEPIKSLNSVRNAPNLYQMIYMSATTDDKLAQGSGLGSKFTHQLNSIFIGRKGPFPPRTWEQLTYKSYIGEIKRLFNTSTPQYREVGSITVTFQQNFPFQI